jgi:hypothetical protein
VNVTDVRFDIEHHTNAYTGKGALTTVEVDRLVRLAAVPDSNSTAPDDYLVWAPSTALTLSTLRVPSTRTGYVYRVSTAGTTGLAEPSVWPTTLGQTFSDGTVTWTVDAAAPWLGVGMSTKRRRWAVSGERPSSPINSPSLGAGKSFNRMETPAILVSASQRPSSKKRQRIGWRAHAAHGVVLCLAPTS